MDQLSEAYSSFSPYAYVANNPVNSIDPDGRKIINNEVQLMEAEYRAWFSSGGGGGFASYFGGGGSGFSSEMNAYFGNTGSGWGTTAGPATFGGTAAYGALMSGQTSSITNVNGRLQWYTLDRPEYAMYHDFDGLLTGATGGATFHSLKVGNDNSTSWDSYKNWADYGSTTIEGIYKFAAGQRTDLYNRGYWIDNLGNQRSIRYAGRAVDSQIVLRSAYVNGTAKFVKYAERARSVGKVLGAIEIGKGIYDDKGHFRKNAQVATAGVVGGLVGAAEGALIGAYIGSFIPILGAGTVLGVVVGAGVGYLYGKIAEGAVEKMYE